MLWEVRKGKFAARIYPNGGSKRLGMYETAEEAAKAYDRAAIEYYGAFALLNFPVEKN